MSKFGGKFKDVCLLALLACTIASSTAKPWDEDEDDWFNSGSEEEEPAAAAGKSLDHSNHNNAKQQQILSNHAAHNETCGPTRKSCVPAQNLVCSDTHDTGRCICAPGYVYVRATETCWGIPNSNEDTCNHDTQCHAGQWQRISRCSKHLSKCECFDYSTNGKQETIQVEGVCYIKKTPGDLCMSHEECDNAIKGGAFCQVGNYTGDGGYGNYTGSCQCRDTHTWYQPLMECLKKATEINDDCVITTQCRAGTLGKHSMCNKNTAQCECHSADNSTEVFYYKPWRKCFPKKAYNETCDEDDECRASLGPDVVCGTTEEYPDEKVCNCPKGMVCRSSGFSTILAASSPYTMGVACTAAVIGVTMSMNGFGG